MTFADVGVKIENFSCEIAEAQMVVTLRRIDRNLAGLEFITLGVLDDFRIVQESDQQSRPSSVQLIVLALSRHAAALTARAPVQCAYPDLKAQPLTCCDGVEWQTAAVRSTPRLIQLQFVRA